MSFNPYEFDRTPAAGRVQTLAEYTSRTFLWMVLGLLTTFCTALVLWMTGLVYPLMQMHLVLLIATLILSITMATRIERMSVGAAKAMFIAFSAIFGVDMAVYLVVFGLPSVITTFLATALYFAALAAYGHFTHADLSKLSTILFSGLVFLVIYGVLSLFIPGMQGMDRVVSLIGIAVFLGYTAYDTQKIRSYYYYYSGYPDMLEKASVFSALQLYLDFLNLFIYLLRYFNSNSNRD